MSLEHIIQDEFLKYRKPIDEVRYGNARDNKILKDVLDIGLMIHLLNIACTHHQRFDPNFTQRRLTLSFYVSRLIKIYEFVHNCSVNQENFVKFCYNFFARKFNFQQPSSLNKTIPYFLMMGDQKNKEFDDEIMQLQRKITRLTNKLINDEVYVQSKSKEDHEQARNLIPRISIYEYVKAKRNSGASSKYNFDTLESNLCRMYGLVVELNAFEKKVYRAYNLDIPGESSASSSYANVASSLETEQADKNPVASSQPVISSAVSQLERTREQENTTPPPGSGLQKNKGLGLWNVMDANAKSFKPSPKAPRKMYVQQGANVASQPHSEEDASSSRTAFSLTGTNG